MRTVVITRFGDPEGLSVVDRPDPRPGPGSVLIRAEAVGVGGVDVVIRSGRIPGMQRDGEVVPGSEVAGVVEGVGDGVDEAWLGRRVWAFTGVGGAYAEATVARVDDLTPLPVGLSSVDAVSLGSAGPVAHFGLSAAHFVPGEVVLVRGAAGSIGLAAVELARTGGATAVVATTSSPERAERLRAHGVTHVVGRDGTGDEDAPAPDVVLDVVAGPATGAFIDRLAPGGRSILVGVVGGFPPADVGQALVRNFQRSLSLGTLSLDTVPRDGLARVRADILRPVADGGLTPVVHDVVDLAEAAQAHRRMEAGEVFGRIVLVP